MAVFKIEIYKNIRKLNKYDILILNGNEIKHIRNF